MSRGSAGQACPIVRPVSELPRHHIGVREYETRLDAVIGVTAGMAIFGACLVAGPMLKGRSSGDSLRGVQVAAQASGIPGGVMVSDEVWMSQSKARLLGFVDAKVSFTVPVSDTGTTAIKQIQITLPAGGANGLDIVNPDGAKCSSAGVSPVAVLCKFSSPLRPGNSATLTVTEDFSGQSPANAFAKTVLSGSKQFPPFRGQTEFSISGA